MENLEILLSDEFHDFSSKIAELHAEKKKRRQELKAFYDKIQEELQALDEEARTVASDFDAWKKSKSKPEDEE